MPKEKKKPKDKKTCKSENKWNNLKDKKYNKSRSMKKVIERLES